MSARNRMESLDAGAPVNLSPYPPVNASIVRIRRLAQEELRRQEAAQRAAEHHVNWCFWPALFLVAVLSQAGTIWHALGMVQP